MKEVTTVRIKFSKEGRLIYISHLDLNRVFSRAFKRAGLPLYYSEGFSPHPRFGFALPLSLGTSSECEFVDIKLREMFTPEEVACRLAPALPPEIRILDAYNSDARFKTITHSDYTVKITSGNFSDSAADDVVSVLTSSPLMIIKKTKSGEKETDISSFISNVSVRYDGGCVTVACRLTADSANYLNPEYLVKLLDSRLSLSLEEDITSLVEIHRTSVYINGAEFR
ncbi:MAG: TIGR03936 family radical SAM-associated protein [Clostridia bacterium]|nr:TIGR03936 family radical SAM-associated protein [Clostridia bacterium]